MFIIYGWEMVFSEKCESYKAHPLSEIGVKNPPPAAPSEIGIKNNLPLWNRYKKTNNFQRGEGTSGGFRGVGVWVCAPIDRVMGPCRLYK